MGVNDTLEQLESCRADAVRLERRIAELEAENAVLRGPDSDERDALVTGPLVRELGQLRKLHEVATERTVQLAAVIEQAHQVAIARGHGLDHGRVYEAGDVKQACYDIADAIQTLAGSGREGGTA